MKYFAATALLFIFMHAFPQNEARKQAIHSFIDGLNAQNYKSVKKQWDPIGKILVSRKKLRAQYGAFFEKNGQGKIVNIVHSAGSNYTADVVFEKRKSVNKHVYFQFNFNDKNQVNGFGFGFPTFHYPKKEASGSYDEAKLAAVIRTYSEQNGQPFNGSVYLTQEGKTLMQYSEGFADQALQTHLDADTRFQLASCSKTFTALAVMRLAEAGKISLDAPVSTYLTDFPYKDVKVRNLLSHTSGIPDYQQLLAKYRAGKNDLTNADVISVYSENNIPLHFVPDASFEYSNINYILLATIVEKASGKTFGDYLLEHVTRPLGMKDTRVYTTRRDGELIPDYAIGYVWDEKTQTYQVPDSLKEYQFVIRQDGLTGDDNVCSSADEMNRFLGIFEQQSLVSDELMQKMCSPYPLSNGELSKYGYGLGVIKQPEMYTVYSHSGSWPGYLTCFFSIPEKNIRLVILSNYSNEQVQLMANDLLQTILE